MNTEANQDVVKFQGVDILTFTKNDRHYIAIKPLCDTFGIDWSAQFRKLKRDDLFSSTIAVMATVGADDRNREMTCLPLEVFPMWLARINTSRVENPFAAQMILEFQQKATEVLYHYFLGDPEELQRELQKAKHRRMVDSSAIVDLYRSNIFGDIDKFYQAQWWYRLHKAQKTYTKTAELTDSTAGTVSTWIKRYEHYLDATRHERRRLDDNFDGAGLLELADFYDSFGTLIKAVKQNDWWLRRMDLHESKTRVLRDGTFYLVNKNQPEV